MMLVLVFYSPRRLCTDHVTVLTLTDETKDEPLQPNASLDKRRINHDRRKPSTTVEWERTMSKSDVKFVLIKVRFKEVNDDSDLWRIKNALISVRICQNPWSSDILHLLSSLVWPWLVSQRRNNMHIQWTSESGRRRGVRMCGGKTEVCFWCFILR